MELYEVNTLISDYVLAAASVWFAARLYLGRTDERGVPWFPLAFLVLGLGSLTGGTYHGFFPDVSSPAAGVLWTVTLELIATSSFLLVIGLVREVTSDRTAQILLTVFGLKWIVVLGFNLHYRSFFYTVLNYGLDMLVLLAISLWFFRRAPTGLGWMITGVLVTFVGSAIQQLNISPHRYFNHNDLYHAVQLFALYGFYRGAGNLTSSCPDSTDLHGEPSGPG